MTKKEIDQFRDGLNEDKTLTKNITSFKDFLTEKEKKEEDEDEGTEEDEETEEEEDEDE